MVTGRPKISLTESQIKYAMSMTYSNREAAKFLNISYNTYKKYAKLYVDPNLNKTLFELHLYANKSDSNKRPNIKRENNNLDTRKWNSGYKERLEDILRGEMPWYQPRKLRKRLFASNYIPLVCASCGWTECRITDGNVPLLLAFKDGNWRNKQLENIYLLCFNCYFLQIGSQGHYWQGMTYGGRNKPRGDGKPKGWKGKKKNNSDAARFDTTDNNTGMTT